MLPVIRSAPRGPLIFLLVPLLHLLGLLLVLLFQSLVSLMIVHRLLGEVRVFPLLLSRQSLPLLFMPRLHLGRRLARRGL